MESLEINKAFASVLTAGIAFMVAGLVAGRLVHPTEPSQAVIKIAGLKAPGAAAPAAPPEIPIAVALQTANPQAGEALTKRLCVSCHSFNQGGKAIVGPNLYGVVGGPHAHMPGYSYSAAIKAKKGPWTFAELNTWLTNPRAYAPGTKMSFAGLDNERERANIIDYLRTNAAQPEPLPPAPAPAAASTPAGTHPAVAPAQPGAAPAAAAPANPTITPSGRATAAPATPPSPASLQNQQHDSNQSPAGSLPSGSLPH